MEGKRGKMKEEILKVKEEIQNYIKESSTLQKLEEIRVNYMGKKGIFTELSKKMKDLSAEERPKIGQIINEVKEKEVRKLDEELFKDLNIEGVTDEKTIANLSLNNNNKDWEAFIDKIDLEDFEKGKPSEELIIEDIPTTKIIIKTDKKEYSKTDIQANKTWDYITKQIIDIKYSQ